MDGSQTRKERIEQLNTKVAGMDPRDVLIYFLGEYKDKIVQASGMGAEDQVSTDMIAGIDTRTRIFTLDTGRLYQETYDLIQRTGEEYNMTIEVFFPDYKKVQEMVREKGINLFSKSIENRKMCCNLRKNESLKRALSGMDVWICGLRKDSHPVFQ